MPALASTPKATPFRELNMTVCVCAGERETETERDRNRDKERERQRHRKGSMKVERSVNVMLTHQNG